MSAQRGRLFVLEGLDGSGTTTQTRLIGGHFDKKGLPVSLTYEPTAHPVGQLIREGLAGNLRSGDGLGKIALSEGALVLLFAADRIEHSLEIEALRDAGTHVICDRYVLSSIAYQSLDPAISPERVIEANRGIAMPDLTVLIEVPVHACLSRLEKRSGSPTVYEKKDTLEAIAANYAATLQLYERHFGPVVRVDGTEPIDTVTEAILTHLSPFIGK